MFIWGIMQLRKKRKRKKRHKNIVTIFIHIKANGEWQMANAEWFGVKYVFYANKTYRNSQFTLYEMVGKKVRAQRLLSLT